MLLHDYEAPVTYNYITDKTTIFRTVFTNNQYINLLKQGDL